MIKKKPANNRAIPVSVSFLSGGLMASLLFSAICVDANMTTTMEASLTETRGGSIAGITLPDRSLHAGISPDTSRLIDTTPKDAPLSYTFNQAQAYCAGLHEHGHKDWRVPTEPELNVLFQNRVAIGGFDTTDSHPTGWYWSSSLSRVGRRAWAQRFSDGSQDILNRENAFALRCVRG